MAFRQRESIRRLENLHPLGDTEPLEKVIRASKGLQALDTEYPNSFFNIAGYHGEPFIGEQKPGNHWWGGYCNHGNVLFPTWHRAYLLNLENAMRSIKDYVDPKPAIFTTLKLVLDGMEIDNPLFSYKLQKRLTETINNHRYSKQVGHETVRYPLAGLVGTKEDAESTDLHNSLLEDPSTRLNILNDNVRAWLNGTVVIPGDGDPTHEPKIPDTRTPDTYSIGSRFKLCLNAPNYTVFPNTTSAKAWNEARWYDPNTILNTVYPIESPHNAIHLAVGRSYQFAEYNADPIRGANGDMGDNETAAFDPIFFFHHCFIHYVFWGWQKKMGLAAAGSLDIISSTSPWPETFTEHRVAWSALGDHSEHANSLHPFKYTSYDVTDITPLGFSYGKGSLVYLFQLPLKQDAPDPLSEVAILLKSHQIDRADYPGSFGVRTFATVDSDGTTPAKKVEIGRDAILSRWNVANCANCSNKLSVQSLVPVNQALSDELKNWADVAEIKYESTIQTHFDIALTAAVGGGLSPITEPL